MKILSLIDKIEEIYSKYTKQIYILDAISTEAILITSKYLKEFVKNKEFNIVSDMILERTSQKDIKSFVSGLIHPVYLRTCKSKEPSLEKLLKAYLYQATDGTDFIFFKSECGNCWLGECKNECQQCSLRLESNKIVSLITDLKCELLRFRDDETSYTLVSLLEIDSEDSQETKEFV